jgi:M6 family metalloprotease-like protein
VDITAKRPALGVDPPRSFFARRLLVRAGLPVLAGIAVLLLLAGSAATPPAAARAAGRSQAAGQSVGGSRTGRPNEAGGGASAELTVPPVRTWKEALRIRCLPSSGTITYPVVIIDFPDKPSEITTAQVETALNATDGTGLRGFYQRASYGALDLHADVLGIYHAPYPSTSVDTTAPDWERHLVEEAFQHFAALGHDFGQYDHDGDGVIDYSIAIWTRNWDIYYTGWQSPGAQAVDGVKVGAFAWLNQWNVGTATHETGHALGLVDLYDVDASKGPPGGVGNSDLMGGAAADVGAFGKVMLGWIQPTVVSSGSRTVTLRPSSRYPDAAIVMPGYSLDSPRKEFFIVQARDATANDATTYATWGGLGLQIWHVDAVDDAATGAFQLNNSSTAWKLCRLMEADGLEQIEAGLNDYTGDLYRTGQSFSASTTPSSRPYWGTASGVSVTGISVGAGSITCTLTAGANDLDVTPPVTTPSVQSGWYNHLVQVGLTVSDAHPTWTRYRGNGEHADWVDWDGATPILVTEGHWTIEYYSCDYAGNAEEVRRLEIGVDTKPPAGTFALAGGAATTSSASVSVDSRVTDANALEMRFLTSAEGFGAWQAYAPTTTLNLPGGAGAKGVVAQYRDPAGNVLELSDSIELTGPATPVLRKVSPASGKPKATVTLTGKNFGAKRGAGYVKFGARRATKYISWSGSRIKCRVPANAVAGKLKVVVVATAGASNAKAFKVKR